MINLIKSSIKPVFSTFWTTLIFFFSSLPHSPINFWNHDIRETKQSKTISVWQKEHLPNTCQTHPCKLLLAECYPHSLFFYSQSLFIFLGFFLSIQSISNPCFHGTCTCKRLAITSGLELFLIVVQNFS